MALQAPQLSEIVIKTTRFESVRGWYETLLCIQPFFVRPPGKEPSWTGAMSIAFYRLHIAFPYTQVLGIFEIPGVGPRSQQTRGDPGLHHMQLRNASLAELFERYDVLKAAGILPKRTFNHGPGTSFYYEDPDGNSVELSSTNFDREEDYLAYFTTEAYKKNISGIEIDAEAYIARFRSGVPQAELIKFPA